MIHSNEELVAAAKARERNSYAPFSDFHVGAALETEDGEIIAGCNVESASYGLTVCAERVAIWKAISEGKHQDQEHRRRRGHRRADASVRRLSPDHMGIWRKRTRDSCQPQRQARDPRDEGTSPPSFRYQVPEVAKPFRSPRVCTSVPESSSFTGRLVNQKPGVSLNRRRQRSVQHQIPLELIGCKDLGRSPFATTRPLSIRTI